MKYNICAEESLLKAIHQSADTFTTNDFMDCMTQMQIGRAQKSVGKAIKQVEEIRKALLLMKED